MIIEVLILLIAIGVWFPRPQPWQLLGQIVVAFLIFLWIVRTFAPALVRL